jgi:hypothetical protein
MAILNGVFPLATETNVSLDSWIPLVWGEKVNEFYRNKLVAAPFFTDRSDELSGGGDTLYTPNTAEFNATAKTTGVAVTLNSNSDTKVTLSVNNWFESSFAIEDAEAAQVKHSYSLMERFAKNCGYAVAKKLDTAIVTLFQGFTNTVGSSTNLLGDSDIRAAFAYLESAGADTDEAAFFVSPNVFWNQIQKIDKFSLAVNSPINDPTAKVPAAFLYGRPVYVTNQITLNSTPSGGRSNALAVPDAIHWATSPLGSGGSKSNSYTGSMGVRVQSNYLPEYLSTVTTADILYGAVENRDTGGVQILTSSL